MVFFPGVYPILQLELLGFWAIPLVTEPNGIGAAPPFHLRIETVPVSESLCSCGILNNGKSRNSVMLRQYTVIRTLFN
jgi:hypothetical protein